MICVCIHKRADTTFYNYDNCKGYDNFKDDTIFSQKYVYLLNVIVLYSKRRHIW